MVGQDTVTATVGSLTGTAVLNVTAPVLTGLSASPSTQSVPKGASVSFTATGTYSDGSTQDLTATASWSSSNPAVAKASAGSVRGVSPGTATITAASGGLTATGSVTVTAAVLKSITVTPSPVQLAKGTATQLAAVGTVHRRHDLGVDRHGHLGVVGAGRRRSGVDQLGQPRVGERPQRRDDRGDRQRRRPRRHGCGDGDQCHAEVDRGDPGQPVGPKGTTVTFVATGTFSDGTTQVLSTQATWKSSSTSVASISSVGVATANNLGSAKITATFAGITGSRR